MDARLHRPQPQQTRRSDALRRRDHRAVTTNPHPTSPSATEPPPTGHKPIQTEHRQQPDPRPRFSPIPNYPDGLLADLRRNHGRSRQKPANLPGFSNIAAPGNANVSPPSLIG